MFRLAIELFQSVITDGPVDDMWICDSLGPEPRGEFEVLPFHSERPSTPVPGTSSVCEHACPVQGNPGIPFGGVLARCVSIWIGLVVGGVVNRAAVLRQLAGDHEILKHSEVLHSDFATRLQHHDGCLRIGFQQLGYDSGSGHAGAYDDNIRIHSGF